MTTKLAQLRIVVTLAELPEGGCGITVATDPFTPAEIPDAVGANWVGMCKAINAHVRSRGMPDFDCMRHVQWH